MKENKRKQKTGFVRGKTFISELSGTHIHRRAPPPQKTTASAHRTGPAPVLMSVPQKEHTGQ